MSIRGNRHRGAAPFILLWMILAASSLTCNIGLADSTNWTQTESALTQLVVTRAAFDLGMTQTALAAVQLTRAAPTPTSPASGAHSPSILSVDFPATIPADGTYVHGSIRFVDAGGDVNLVIINTLEGSFASGTWDPTGTITWTGTTGVAPFETRCTAPQSVRARVILKDLSGGTSVHADFGFACS